MTDQPSVYVWDASALHHVIKADRADVLLDLADHAGETSRQHVTTAAVAEELSLHNLSLPSRIDVVNVDGLNEIVALATWVNLMSSSRHNRGEATVCAWAEVRAIRSSLANSSVGPEVRASCRRFSGSIHNLRSNPPGECQNARFGHLDRELSRPKQRVAPQDPPPTPKL